MAKHYTIDGTTIYADILALTAKEEAEVEKFRKYGYTVVNKQAEAKATVKRLDDDYITKYLEKLPDEESKKALATYEGLKKEVAKDEEGKKKTTKTGKDQKRGFNAGRNWFAKTYPADASTLETEIETAGLAKDFDKQLKNYTTKNQTNSDAMKPDEYKRYYYWTKVFERK